MAFYRGNKIENSPHYQYGLAGCIDIVAVSQELDINESRVRNFIQEFIRFGWLKDDHHGDIYDSVDLLSSQKNRHNILCAMLE